MSIPKLNKQKSRGYETSPPALLIVIGTGWSSTVSQEEVPGTGGCNLPQGVNKLYISINRSVPVKSLIKSINILPSNEQLNYVRNVFCFNISELADIFGVTRPTIYSWINGTELKPEVSAKMTKLVNLASYLEKLNISRFDTLLHRPIFNGISLFDKVKNGEDIKEPLRQIKEISEKEVSVRKENKSRITTNGGSDPSDYSTPYYKD